jgi:rubrerythrin
MAIQSYSQFIREVKNPEIKETFKEIQNDHNRHMEKISQRILDLGGGQATAQGWQA